MLELQKWSHSLETNYDLLWGSIPPIVQLGCPQWNNVPEIGEMVVLKLQKVDAINQNVKISPISKKQISDIIKAFDVSVCYDP